MPLFNSSQFNKLLANQGVILSRLTCIEHKLGELMSTSTVGFSDVQASVTKLVNDNTASNNTISAQLKEVKQLVLDYSTATQAGTPPTQAQFQSLISQLSAVDSMVVQNTAAIQATSDSIVNADPDAAQPPAGSPDVPAEPAPAPVASNSSSTVTGADKTPFTANSPIEPPLKS